MLFVGLKVTVTPASVTAASNSLLTGCFMRTGIGFQPTGDGKAAITGDFVMTADEVNPVIKTLRANGIEVTALHSHMLDEQPRLFFMHFWANDDAIKLAKGLRGALDDMANIKNSL